jgi:uncharacterized protein (DUF1697 family)
MRYVALLRGINVGGNRPVEMKRLKGVFEALGCTDVATYLNSGNASFASGKGPNAVRHDIERALVSEFGFEVSVLVKTAKEMQTIAESIPAEWQNDAQQRTDVAYLFDEIDSREVVDGLPLNREVVNISYLKGAVIWNYDRKDHNKTRLNNLVGHPDYKLMTIRNVNTARHLGGLV